MRTRSRRRLGWSAAWTLALVVGLPALAEAQTTELFPFARIRREKTPCALEDPVYKMYRQQYYGYHPTCWRKFPDGWGCPSPEAPNATQEFKRLPRDPVNPPDEEQDGGMAGPRGDAAGPRPRGNNPGLNPNNLALPPDSRSPFEMDTKPDAPPDGAKPPVRNSAPAPAPGNDGGAGLPPVAEPAVGAPSPTSHLPAPSSSPVIGTSERLSHPILSVPDPTVTPSTVAMAPEIVPPPAQAPRRTGFISNLFGGRSLFRR